MSGAGRDSLLLVKSKEAVRGTLEGEMVKVLVVEDSPVVCEFLVHILNSDPEIRVVGTARDGKEALQAVERVKPDVVTMDVHMPGMNGFDATRRIMETHPTPIVIVSGSSDSGEVARSFAAIEAGALTAVTKPVGWSHPDFARAAAELIQTVKLMSEVKVVRRWAHLRPSMSIPAALPARPLIDRRPAVVEWVAIGASTGGPPALQTILSGLPCSFPARILIVQHMTKGFIQGFADWLAESSGLPIQVARHDEPALPGHAYIAPDGVQMEVSTRKTIVLTRGEPVNGHRPSVSYLFRSLADFYGEKCIGVLLTGMGKDGAEELKLMKEKGAVTIAQDRESSVVHGMPGEAINLGAATYVFPPERIAMALTSLTPRRTG